MNDSARLYCEVCREHSMRPITVLFWKCSRCGNGASLGMLEETQRRATERTFELTADIPHDPAGEAWKASKQLREALQLLRLYVADVEPNMRVVLLTVDDRITAALDHLEESAAKA